MIIFDTFFEKRAPSRRRQITLWRVQCNSLLVARGRLSKIKVFILSFQSDESLHTAQHKKIGLNSKNHLHFDFSSGIIIEEIIYQTL